jgi:hypothetical protein
MALTFSPETTFVYATGLGFSPNILVPPGMQGVTEAEAEAVLAELRPWLQEPPPFDQFWKQLEMTVARTRVIRQATMYWRRAAFSQAGRPVPQAKLYFFSNTPAWGVLGVADEPEGDPERLLAQRRPRKGPAPRTWYPGFVRDLAKIAKGIGIKVTTASGWTDETHATPFTRFVRAVEKLLPREEHSPSFAACAKRIERAIASADAGGPAQGEATKTG